MHSQHMVGRSVTEVLGKERWKLLKPHLERVRAGEALAVERLVKFADGRKRWMTVRLTPRVANGEYLGYYATTSDIHEQKSVEQQLRRTNSILSAHFDNTPLAVIEWDTELRVVRWSGQAEAVFGYNAAEVLGRSLAGWRHIYEEDEPAARRMIDDLMHGRERHSTLRHRNYRKDGSVIWVEWHNSALRDETGRVISILSLAQDVSSRIQAEERLQYMATHDGRDAETLLKNADAAMYHAKELGRNGFRTFSTELAARRTQRMQVETALRRALKEDELTLHYQPIVDIASGEVRHVEALIRWNDPERGLMLPQGFIPLAEESGLGHAIGHWVMEAACRQARAWRDAGLGGITVCVNLSAGQLRDTAMLADLKRLLAKTGCEPAWLQFEITRTTMVPDAQGPSVMLAKLRTLGVRIAIDDFGTGFSSLSHLRHLPVDVLKIDKAFVADIDARPRKGENAGGAAIVSAVIGVPRGLGLQVVAEGVEKRSQLNFLAREGCHAGQGYLLCAPLPAAEFEAWLRNRRKPAKKKVVSVATSRKSTLSR